MHQSTSRNNVNSFHDTALKYFKAGKIEAAEAELKKLLSRKPQYAPSLYLLGLIEHDRGHFKIAADLCRQAIVADRKNVNSYNILGLALHAQGKLDEAATCYRRAIELKPNYVTALNNLGIVLGENKHFDEAIAIYHRILDIKPNHAEAHHNLGALFEAAGSLPKAEECYRRAIVIKPDYAEAYYNLGLVLKKSGLPAEAEQNLLRSLALRPANAEALQLLGIVQKYQGRIEEAIQSFNRAVSLNPNLVDAHYSLANLQLIRDDFTNGWRGYECRLRASWYGNRTFAKPIWSREALHDKAILLHSEQGFGDTILFLRYAPLMALRAGRVIVEVPRPLAHVAATLRGRGQVIATGDPVPEFDFYLPLPSLPERLATSPETIPNKVPYLFAHEPLIKKWQEELRDPACLTIGLAWAGNPKQENDQYRSIDVETLQPILSLPGIRWFSLQSGKRAADLARLSSSTIIDLSPRLTDFAETAAAIANLDLIITVDTAIAHLAGAMGRPVWVLVSSIPDWRYFPTTGEYNAWYPTMRIFRQTKLKNWNDVLSRVCEELRELAAGYRYIQQIAFQPSGNAQFSYAAASDDRTEGFDPAEDKCIQILASNPRHFDSIYRLALIIGKRGQHQIAEQLLLRALLLMPNSAAAHNDLGVAQNQTGKIESAIGSLRRALAFNPNYPQAFNNLGYLLTKHNNLDEAIHNYSSALKLQPEYPEAIYNLAVALKDRGQLDAAVEKFRSALELKPAYPKAQNMLGVVLAQKGEINEAISCYRAALRLRPDYPEVYNNLAMSLGIQGNLDQALKSYDHALKLKPNFPEAYNNRGAVLAQHGRLTEAIGSYRKALELKADYAHAQNNLGNALQERGCLKEALQCYRQAIALDPSNTPARSNLLLCLNYMPELNPQEIYAEHKAWQQSLPPLPNNITFPNDRKADRRIKVGYVSGDFKNHPVAFFFEPLLKAHNRQNVEVFCYSVVDKEDGVTARLKKNADHWIPVTRVDAKTVAQRIRRDCIDILVDLGGHTSGGFLSAFALKPAPIQISWLGYPNTTGLTAIDYRITDSIADPVDEDGLYHSEKLIRLPSFLCYRPPDTAPAVTDLPARAAGHITFGSFNNLTKVTAQVVALWAKVLHAVEGSRLVIKAKQLADAATAADIASHFASEGIPRERLDLLPRQRGTKEHLAHYERVDIALDTFPYNGTTTTCEALWMGVPVICLRGDRHAARVGASLLTTIGLSELIADDRETYVAKAANLASDLNRITALRASLRSNLRRSPLCDAARFAGVVELAYRIVWQRWCTVRSTPRDSIHPQRETTNINLKHSYDAALEHYNARRFDLAKAELNTLLGIRPDHFDSLCLLAIIDGQKEKHKVAEQLLYRAIATKPNSDVAYNNLGISKYHQGRFDEAITSFRRAIAFNPDNPDAYFNLARLLVRTGHLDEAIKSYRKALRLKPSVAFDPSYVTSRSNLLLCMNYAGDLNAEEIYAEHLAWASELAPPPEKLDLAFPNSPEPNRRLRVGYVSCDFKNHSVAFFFEPLLKAHNRKNVELFCYSLVDKEDSVTTRIKGLADHWIHLTGSDAKTVAKRIRQDRVDILVDLGGHTSGGGPLSAFALKPAPIQVTWLGYPNTTGLAAIDYRITDSIADPEDEGGRYHSEKLIRLPCFLCYRPPDNAPPVAELPARALGYITFGSFNNLAKMTVQVVAQWAKILRAVERSRLLIKAMPFQDPAIAAEVVNRFAAEGIWSERLCLLPWQREKKEHLAHYSRVDIALDPFPYNGTTTTCEALWMGVPVICLRGDRHAGRVGASLLTTTGLHELIADDLQTYVMKAVSLAHDFDRIAALRASLRERMQSSSLCNFKQFAREIEQAYRAMWQRWCTDKLISKGSGSNVHSAVSSLVQSGISRKDQKERD